MPENDRHVLGTSARYCRIRHFFFSGRRVSRVWRHADQAAARG
jgi:hypothetical protein